MAMRISDGEQFFVRIVDDAEHVDKLTAILDEMLTGGMVTIEQVRVLRYAPASS
jgi:PII-like signaling protein